MSERERAWRKESRRKGSKATERFSRTTVSGDTGKEGGEVKRGT